MNFFDQVVTLLLRHGADPMKPNKKGKRPVDLAEDDDIIQLLNGQLPLDEPFSSSASSASSEADKNICKTVLFKSASLSDSFVISSSGCFGPRKRLK